MIFLANVVFAFTFADLAIELVLHHSC